MNAEQLATAVKAIDVKPGTIVSITYPSGDMRVKTNLQDSLAEIAATIADHGGMVVLLPDDMPIGILSDDNIAQYEDFLNQCKAIRAKATT